MSFGESVFVVGFIQKTIKVDLNVRINRAYPQWDGHQKDLEYTRGYHTTAKGKPMPGRVGRAHLSVSPSNDGSPPP
jgi:hypothetical protein